MLYNGLAEVDFSRNFCNRYDAEECSGAMRYGCGRSHFATCGGTLATCSVEGVNCTQATLDNSIAGVVISAQNYILRILRGSVSSTYYIEKTDFTHQRRLSSGLQTYPVTALHSGHCSRSSQAIPVTDILYAIVFRLPRI
jgi:hypothetical protein